MPTIDDSENRRLGIHFDLQRHASNVLGKSAWMRLHRYGRLTDGLSSGSYLSGIDEPVARAIVDALAAGQAVDVHLMHRHVSGSGELSSLQFREGRLIMLFKDRSEFADSHRKASSTQVQR
jgi:hypothetical protein